MNKGRKIDRRVEFILAHRDKIIAAIRETEDHSQCMGNCTNGRTCRAQSSPGWGWWARAFEKAGIDCKKRSYWSGMAPTPSTSINRGAASFIEENAPDEIR